MAGSSLAATKRRISSINTTLKITNAMKVVATAKLKTYKSKLGVGLDYALALKDILSRVLSSIDKDDPDNINNYAVGEKKLILLVTSTLGLCGAYNANILKEFYRLYEKGDEVLVIGSKGYDNLRFNGIKVDTKFISSFHAFDYSVSRQIGNELLKRFKTKSYKSVVVLGTEFVNSIIYKPIATTLFPVRIEGEKRRVETIEPSPEEVFKELLPQYINSLVYTILLNSLVSEFGSRRNAMESASDNADSIIQELRLVYNKARQAAITQEITEVVSGANASSN